MASQLIGLPPSDVLYQSGHTAEDIGVTYAYLRQSHVGIPFANCVANVALKDGRVTTFGSSFVKGIGMCASFPSLDSPLRITSILCVAEFPSPTPTIPRDTAIEIAKAAGNGEAETPGTDELQYYATSQTTAALVYSIQVENDADGTAYEVYVDAHKGDVVAAVNYVAS